VLEYANASLKNNPHLVGIFEVILNNELAYECYEEMLIWRFEHSYVFVALVLIRNFVS